MLFKRRIDLFITTVTQSSKENNTKKTTPLESINHKFPWCRIGKYSSPREEYTGKIVPNLYE